MREQRHTEKREAVRGESFVESAKAKHFIDEFGQVNPHVGTGSCRPATKGKLAEPVKRAIAAEFVHSILNGKNWVQAFQKLSKRYGKTIALQLIDDELVKLIAEKFRIEMDLRIQQIHEWFGE